MQKGFTLIEIMIVVVVLGILLRLGFLVGSGDTSWTWATGWTEERCMGGFKFIKGTRGSPVQVMDAQGHGVPCK
jgi:prepilin-type N-terminal cleavage/methylation domain-containing protein